MEELKKQLAEYIRAEINPSNENHFSYKDCDIPYIRRATNSLNYVSCWFIANYFGTEPVRMPTKGDYYIEITADNLGNSVLVYSDQSCNAVTLYSGYIEDFVITVQPDLVPTDEEIKHHVDKIIELFDEVIKHYTTGIDKLVYLRSKESNH